MAENRYVRIGESRLYQCACCIDRLPFGQLINGRCPDCHEAVIKATLIDMALTDELHRTARPIAPTPSEIKPSRPRPPSAVVTVRSQIVRKLYQNQCSMPTAKLLEAVPSITAEGVLYSNPDWFEITPLGIVRLAWIPVGTVCGMKSKAGPSSHKRRETASLGGAA